MTEGIHFFGSAVARYIVIQPMDENDRKELPNQIEMLRELYPVDDWAILPVMIKDWNHDLTPWTAKPIFGKVGFGNGAENTLKYIVEEVIPTFEKEYPLDGRKYFLCGYSLAGLFSLWAGYQTDIFAGVGAVSPSVWYQDWQEYAKEHRMKIPKVYLSLGDKEENAKNKVLATVGDAIRSQFDELKEQGVTATLEWNEGNHFVDSGKRMAKALAWLFTA